MTPLEGPDTGLVELYELFGRLRQTRPAAARRHLAFQVILHPAAMKRLRCAVTRYRKRSARHHPEFAEVLQDTLLCLVRCLTAESLPYDDRGVKPFSGWYFTLCRNASREVLRKYRGPDTESLNLVEEQDLPLAPEPTLAELRWQEVLAVISQIPHPAVKAAMVDLAAGITEGQTALTYNMSVPAVSRLRQKGLSLVRRAFREEMIGHSGGGSSS